MRVVGRDGIYLLSEGAALASIGHASGDLVGQSIFDVHRHRPDILDDLRRALAGEALHSVRALNGRVWETQYAPLREGDTPVGTLSVALDVTARARAEAQLRASEAHFRSAFAHTAPLDVQRVHPAENATAIAVAQIARLLPRLPGDGTVPLFVFDAGYDAVALQQGLADRRAALLVRLRSGRCCYGDPPPAPPRPKGGRPFRHGHKLACDDPATWPPPTAERVVEDVHSGTVRVRAWAGLHPKRQGRTGQGTKGQTPIVRMTLVRVEVERLPRPTRAPQVLWLWWHVPADHPLDLDFLWRAYVRRFDLEHIFRFLKQARGWQTLRARHPEQADRWTWLVLVVYSQLRLARAGAVDRRLPWERAYPAGRLTPGRVRRAVAALPLARGTPVAAPQPCGRSPGRPKGRRSPPAPRHPAIKKAA